MDALLQQRFWCLSVDRPRHRRAASDHLGNFLFRGLKKRKILGGASYCPTFYPLPVAALLTISWDLELLI